MNGQTHQTNLFSGVTMSSDRAWAELTTVAGRAVREVRFVELVYRYYLALKAHDEFDKMFTYIFAFGCCSSLLLFSSRLFLFLALYGNDIWIGC